MANKQIDQEERSPSHEALKMRQADAQLLLEINLLHKKTRLAQGEISFQADITSVRHL